MLAISAGVVSNSEQSETDTLTTNLEGSIKVTYDIFSFSQPNIIVSTVVSPFVSITDWGRIRMDSHLNTKWEVFNNFYFKITFYYNLDTKPPTTSASKYDFGLTFGISYTF
jgi:hypothetical protein